MTTGGNTTYYSYLIFLIGSLIYAFKYVEVQVCICKCHTGHFLSIARRWVRSLFSEASELEVSELVVVKEGSETVMASIVLHLKEPGLGHSVLQRV